MLEALQIRQPSASHSTLVLGAGACTEVPLAELARNSDEVVLADLDLASMQQARDELSSPALRKRVRFLSSDICGGVSANLNRLIGRQPWSRLVLQDAQAVYHAAARSLQQCPVPDPPQTHLLHPRQFRVRLISMALTQ